ncbi:MAG TPA: LysR substrate-binding domain-containing protein, partial [Burkholderiales bacterium]|nr:LysR substrate-binding domain-containing protein [Burkholderiales bacterium]
PTYLVGDDIRAGRLQAVLTGYRLRETSIHAIYPHRLHLSPKIRVFVDFIAGRLGERPGWDAFDRDSTKPATRRVSTDSVTPAHRVRKRGANIR